ncbi:hypothetical protein BWQ96_05979 [Gracilariopsis chorda]|uniref:Uncharacterized protein n=1 Tax=Gracilariopsis chorda TaxID=448386 RepID=A0A2V3IQA5_9FLOR|nr:hypothetical protein BWQ96_05979 [Gracilariopsis chorda]|eukprot:PXF44275.1 hypothetical protein BWQ96_05979 [Gracilariopsis chorda]
MYQQNVPMNKDDEISVGEEDDSDSEDDLDPVEVDWDQLLQPSTLENTEGIHESLAVEEVNIGERRSYEDLVEHVLNLQESVSQITSLALPILFSSLAEFMETSANGNRNILEKWTNLERGHMTLEELRAKCKHDKMIFLSGDLGGSDLEKKPLNLAPATRDSSVAGERITWSVDVDSVDVLSIPSGGCVFGICEVRIPNTFQPHMIAPRNVLKKNNNLCNVYQYDDEQYPGNYFLRDIFGRRSSPSNTESIFDPIAFKVFDVKLSFCIDPIPLYAVVPYLCLKLLMEGGGSLLQLFLNSMTVDEKKSTVSSNERRSLCYKTVWYMFTEFLLMAMRKVSAPVNFNKFQTRLPCCAHLCWQGTFVFGFKLYGKNVSGFGIFLHLPVNDRVPQYSNSDYFETPRHLFRYFGGSSAVKQVLEYGIDDPATVEYFTVEVWKGSLGSGLINLNPDADGFGQNGLPSAESNRLALERGNFVLQDLLLIAPIVVRLYLHGMWKELVNSAEVTELQERIQMELDAEKMIDSIVDVGYTLYASSGAETDVSIHLPRATISSVNSNPFLPSTAAHRTNANLGMTMFSAHLYPICTGFQTATLQVGPSQRQLGPSMKKVKVHRTTRHVDASRGETAYSTPVYFELIKKMRSWKVVYANMVASLQAQEERQRKGSKKHTIFERDLKSSFDFIVHDLHIRKEKFKAFKKRIRIEVSYSMDARSSYLNEAKLLLVSQRYRDALSDEDIGLAFSDSSLGGIQKLPWWWSHHLRQFESDIATNDSFPVYILFDVHELEMDIEESLIRQAIHAYLAARRSVLGTNQSSEHDLSSPLRVIKRLYTPSMFSEVCLLITWASIEAAKCFVDGVLCNPNTGIMLDPAYVMQGTGMDVSWLVLGYHCIMVSRVLGIDVKFRKALQRHRVKN